MLGILARDLWAETRDGDPGMISPAGVRVVHDVKPGVDHYFLTEDPVRARPTMAMVAAEIRDARPARG